MEYEDFEVRIRSNGKGGFKVEAVPIPPLSKAVARFKLPYQPEEVESLLQSFEAHLKSSMDGAGRPAIQINDIGKRLFESLFPGKVGIALEKSLVYLAAKGRSWGLRLRLVFEGDNPKLIALRPLPWELLLRVEHLDFLTRQRVFALVRFVEVEQFFPPPEVDSTLRVLVVNAVPQSEKEPDLGLELKAIRDSLASPSFEVEVLEQPTLSMLRPALLRKKWHVLHFIGDGRFEERDGQGYVLFESGAGRPALVTAMNLSENVKGLESLRLVVLSSCSGGAWPRRAGQDPFSSVAPALLRAGVPAVVAMQFPIFEDSAIEFSKAFYQRLAAGELVETAVAEGRLAIYNHTPDSFEWATPVLFLATREGKILDLQDPHPPAPSPGPREEEAEARPLRLGIRSFGGPRGLEMGIEIQTDRYQDFTIDLSSLGPGQFEAKVVESPFRDTVPTVFPAPIAPEVLRALERSFSGSKEEVPSHFELGQQLHAALFRNGLAELFVRSREHVGEDVGLRIRLRFRLDDEEAEYLGALPWEMLCKPNAEFLSTDLSTPVVREIQAAKPFKRLAVMPPLRILVVDSPASEYDKTKQKQQKDLLFDALKPLIDAKQVELKRLKEAKLSLLRKALRTETIHVLHFMGHGGFDAESGAGMVSFVSSDKKLQADAEMLADHLKGARHLRLVVINSCSSARHAGYVGAPYNYGVASTILERTSVRAVLANQYAISHGAAIELTRLFYEGIAMGDGVDTAITEARMQMRHRSREWATPVLFLSAPDGKLFDFQPAERPAPVEKLEPQKEEIMPLHLGIRSFDGWGRDMDSQADAVLNFVHLFEERIIKRKESWQEEIFPGLKDFFRQHVDERRPLLLDFAAHSSIAFAAGWLLEVKSGLDVRVRQRIQGSGALDWHPDEGGVPDGPLWLDEPDLELAAGAPDIALALAVSQPEIGAQVQDYVQRKGLPVGRVLRATIAPAPGPRSVQGGAHALRLAQSLLPIVRQRRPHERGGCVHVFGAAPNALMFYLGQLSRSFGRILLYEHPFGAADAWGKYQPSIRLDASDESALDPEDW